MAQVDGPIQSNPKPNKDMILATAPSPQTPPPPPPRQPQRFPAQSTTDQTLLNHLSKCTDMSQLKQVHARALRCAPPAGPETLPLYSRILRFSSFRDVAYARHLFDQIPEKNSFVWNTLIGAYARSDDRKEEALRVFERMLEDGRVFPDKHSYPLVLKACAYLFALGVGEQAHGQVFKLGLESDVYICNSLIHFYTSCGRLTRARKVFDEMPERSLVSWNVMIDGLVVDGEFESALRLFAEMQDSFDPDGYTIQSVLNACGGFSALASGMWAHAYILKNGYVGIANDVLVNNCLVDMYCKCGSMDLALQVFERMPKRDINSWNSIIHGLAMHGKGALALEYFESAISTRRIVPNSITFVAVLSACNHCCMVTEGRKYFELMVNEYKIQPQLEHFGCMIDMLARAGLIDEALDQVYKMPVKPDAAIWRSLLGACSKNSGDVTLSEDMAKQILESDGGDGSGVYVLLSRVYASASRWDDVGLIRKLMVEKGVKKEPGCSLIEVDGTSHEFFAGDTSHPRTTEIYQFLDVLDHRMKLAGYKPDFSQAPMVDDVDREKQQSLKVHSERLALALGLLSLKPGVPVRIFKNLTVCRDCHEVSKLTSKLYNVEIIMRDRVRFHHFKDGSCSCMDYW